MADNEQELLRERIAEIIEDLGYDKYGCADQVLAKIKEVVEGAGLTEEQIGLIEWESATLDMSFVDGNKDGVDALLKAQLQAILKAIKNKEEVNGNTARATN